MMGSRTKIILAFVVFVVGMLVATRTLMRSEHRPDPIQSRIPSGLAAWDDLRFSQKSKDNEQRYEGIRDALRQGLLSIDIERGAAEPVVEAALGRIRAILDGDDNAMHALRQQDGQVAPAPSPDSLPEEMRRLADWPTVWREARVDVQRLVCRVIPASKGGGDRGYHSGMSKRSPLRATYPPKSSEKPVLSIVLPVSIPVSPGSSTRLAVQLSLEYQQQKGGNYVFVDCIIYTSDFRAIPPAY